MKKIALFIAAVCFLSACDIDRNPYDKYMEDQVKEDIDIMLTGCYTKLKRWSNNMHFVGEFGGDNVMKQATSTDAWFEFISYMHAPTNYRMEQFWEDSYKIISQSSDLIKIYKEGESDENDQKIGEAYYLRGMMYFYLCRTFGRPYAQSPETNLGVPIVNGLPEDMFNLVLPDRSTVKDTYEQVINDLKKGESLMKSEKRSIFASKDAAQALLSRVYLYMSGTYESPNAEYADLSIQYADKVINTGNYELLDRASFLEYSLLSPEASAQTETIFAVKRVLSEFTSSDLFSSIGGMYSTIDGVGWGEVYASADYLDLLYEAKGDNDARWSYIKPEYGSDKEQFRFVAKVYNDQKEHTGYTYYMGFTSDKNGTLTANIKETDYPLTLVDEENKSYTITYEGEDYLGYVDREIKPNNGYPQFYIVKCSQQDKQSQLHSPIISRLAEMYLNKAEAYVKKGDYANALVALNKVRGRSIEGGEYTSLSADNAATLVDKERRLELAFEAHRTVDVYRNGQTMKRHYPGVHNTITEIKATDDRVIQFIPQREINAYPSQLTQNK